MIKYTLDNRNFGLKVEPSGNKKEPWEILCCGKKEYAEDSVSKRSVSRFMLYVLGVLVSLQMKMHRSMMLFILEA